MISILLISFFYQFLQAELNSFYLKYLLWVPPEHPINTYRALLLFMCSIPGTREAYQYLTDKSVKESIILTYKFHRNFEYYLIYFIINLFLEIVKDLDLKHG